MTAAIRHLSTSRAIVAYLAAASGVCATVRIVGYMQLMHGVKAGATRESLRRLERRGLIAHPLPTHYTRGAL